MTDKEYLLALKRRYRYYVHVFDESNSLGIALPGKSLFDLFDNLMTLVVFFDENDDVLTLQIGAPQLLEKFGVPRDAYGPEISEIVADCGGAFTLSIRRFPNGEDDISVNANADTLSSLPRPRVRSAVNLFRQKLGQHFGTTLPDLPEL